jgi:hypothetical protein
MPCRIRSLGLALACLAAALASSCASAPERSGAASAPAVRAHDRHNYVVAEAELPFAALADPDLASDRWWGVEGGAGYRIEVPEHWNGRLVMYAHGYRGEGEALTPAAPRFRRELIEAGYAWAASTYSANGYDVPAGIEDTNALALAFTRIAREHGRALPEPERFYIVGHSMGGHIAAAAVETETLARAHHRVRYAGALPLCGSLGDLELFDYFAAYALAAQQLAGVDPASFPPERWRERAPQIVGRLFSSFPSPKAPDTPIVPVESAAARELKTIVLNLSGGARPLFEEGWVRASNGYAWGTFGGAADANGVLLARPQSTERVVYRFTDGARLSPAEREFNRVIPRAHPEPGANPPRPEGLRYVPVLEGNIGVPVLTLHNLGDLFVPFNMEQIYRRRVAARGQERWLVQRAIRSPLHCDFTAAEESSAFTALVGWAERGTRPAGDRVADRKAVAAADFGCAFTDNRTGAEDPGEAAVRAAMPACRAH